MTRIGPRPYPLAMTLADTKARPTDRTRISWMVAFARAHGLRAEPWNPLRGCLAAGSACRLCWAADVAWGREQHPSPAIAARHEGLTRKGADGVARFTGARRLVEDEIDRPLRRRAPTVFFFSEGDLFYEKHPASDVARVLAVAGAAEEKGHVILLLTKRYREMAEILLSGPAREAWNSHARDGQGGARHERGRLGPDSWPARNLIVGVSVWDQDSADRARPHMARLAANGYPVMVSYEPGLGPVDWTGWEFLSWLIAGGEAATGGDSRPMHPAWHETAIQWARAYGIAVFDKQWGDWVPQAPQPDAPIDDGSDPDVLWLHDSGRGRRSMPPDEDLVRGGWARMQRLGKRKTGVPELALARAGQGGERNDKDRRGERETPVLEVPVVARWRRDTEAAPQELSGQGTTSGQVLESEG